MSTIMPLPAAGASRRASYLSYAALTLVLLTAWLLISASPLPHRTVLPLRIALLLAGAAGVLVLRRPHAPRADTRARGIVAHALSIHAANPISAHALSRDKAFFADPDATGGVAYRLCAGVALAAGEPIGPPERRLAIASAFIAHCRTRGWIPAFYQVLDDQVDSYRAIGLRALKVGEEAIVDLPGFTLVGKRIANVRHCVTHCERAGLKAEVLLDGVDDEATLHALETVSAAWLGARTGRGEMGFSMGGFSREALRSTCVALARDAEGRVCAFVTFRRVGGAGAVGVVLDLMRRDERAPSGTIDFLIARALERFQAAGYRYASLSLAPLAGACADGRHPAAERFLKLLYEKGNGVYRYKSLYNFKRKFVPRWESRYLLYTGGPWRLLRVGLAVALVHMPRALRRPSPSDLIAWLAGSIRQALDWRQGLAPGHLEFNVRLMTILTLIFSLPELSTAVHLLGMPRIVRGYGALALVLAICDAYGALALARRLDIGRRVLILAAAGFFVKTTWGLAAGYDGGLLSWIVALVLAPIEVWVIWFLSQPEVRAHLRARTLTASPSRP